MKDVDNAYGVSYMNKQKLKMWIQGWTENREWATILFWNYKKLQVYFAQ